MISKNDNHSVDNILVISVLYNDAGRIGIFAEAMKPYCHIEHMIIDNASTDSSADVAAELFPKAHLLRQPKNIGSTGAWNIAVKWGLTADKEFFWILNPDVIVRADTLRGLLDSMYKDGDAGIVGPAVLYSDKPNIIESYGTYFNVKRGIGYHYNFQEPLDNALPAGREADYVDGGSCLIRSAVFEKVGLFDENLFMYGEEADLCLRAGRSGYKILVTRNAIVYHRHYELTGNRFPLPHHWYYLLRNKVYLAKKHYGTKGYGKALQQVLKSGFVTLLRQIKRGNFKFAGIYILSILDALHLHMGKRRIGIVT